MRWARLRSWAGALFRRSRVDREMDAELRFHVEAHAEDLMRAGATREEASRQARIALGGLDRAKEECRDAIGISFIESVIQDVRFGLRMLRKNPGFTAVAVLTLALGIGANTAIFSIIDGVLWRPIPYAHVSQLATIAAHKRMGSGSVTIYSPVSSAGVRKLRSEMPSIEQLGTYASAQFALTGDGAPELLGGASVSGDFFTTLGAKPILGRPILSSDTQPGQNGVAVLSYALWRDMFGADPHIAGRVLTLDDRRYTVIGVMPRYFEFALDNATDGRGLWTPLVIAPADDNNQAAGPSMIVRLKDGVSLDAANAQLTTIAPRLWPLLPPIMNGCEFYATSIVTPLGTLKTPLLVLMGAVAFVLLIACVNISALLLGRGWSRQREIAMRKALGATRGRIIRQLLAESLLLALAGGCGAVLFTAAAVRTVRAMAPPSQPRIAQARLDPHVLGYTLAISLAACLLFALMPAIQASASSIGEAIKGGIAGPLSALSRRPNRLRSALVVFEIASAVVLVMGAALMGRSLERLARVNLGFRTDHILTSTVRFGESICDPRKKEELPRCKAAIAEVVDGLRASPNVEGAAAASSLPLRSGSGVLGIRIEGQTTEFGFSNGYLIVDRGVSPGYFRTLGIPLLGGRDFDTSDTATSPSVAIVNHAFATRLLGSANVLGARFARAMFGNSQSTWIEIVGVVPDGQDEMHSAEEHKPDPEYYVPLAQLDYAFTPSVIVRTAMEPMSILPALRRQVAAVDKEAPLTDIETMDQVAAESIAEPKFETALLASFGILGLALALVGVYGVISYRVTQRTHEIGVRMALGAQPGSVLGLVLREALVLALAGIAAGLCGAFALTRFLRSLLFEVKPNDPATFGAVAILLMIVALLASYVPARRAMRVDPMIALRHE